jgi:hypothetical protein
MGSVPSGPPLLSPCPPLCGGMRSVVAASAFVVSTFAAAALMAVWCNLHCCSRLRGMYDFGALWMCAPLGCLAIICARHPFDACTRVCQRASPHVGRVLDSGFHDVCGSGSRSSCVSLLMAGVRGRWRGCCCCSVAGTRWECCSSLVVC